MHLLTEDDDAEKIEWLKCYNVIVKEMEKDKEACQNLLSQAMFTDEEREAGHSMLKCDVTDCKYCSEKKTRN